MLSIIRHFLIVCGFLLVVQTDASYAQPDPGTMRERMETSTRELLELLELTDGQKLPVEAILADANETRIRLIDEAQDSGDIRSVRHAMRGLADETEDKLAAVLTEVQMERYRKHQKSQRRNRGRPRN